MHILCITDNEVLELLRPLYGVFNAGDYRRLPFHYHLEKDLDMSSTTGDPALYINLSDFKLDGMVGILVDDKLRTGTSEFEKRTFKSLEKFDFKPQIYGNLDFFEKIIKTISEENLKLLKRVMCRDFLFASKNCAFKELRKRRAMLSWSSNTQPELCSLINRAAQVTQNTTSKRKIAEFNSAVKMTRGGILTGLGTSP